MSNKESGTNGASGGIGFFGLLGIVFIVLKLVKVIDWPWWCVLLPIYAPIVLVALFFIVMIIFSVKK